MNLNERICTQSVSIDQSIGLIATGNLDRGHDIQRLRDGINLIRLQRQLDVNRILAVLQIVFQEVIQVSKSCLTIHLTQLTGNRHVNGIGNCGEDILIREPTWVTNAILAVD